MAGPWKYHQPVSKESTWLGASEVTGSTGNGGSVVDSLHLLLAILGVLLTSLIHVGSDKQVYVTGFDPNT